MGSIWRLPAASPHLPCGTHAAFSVRVGEPGPLGRSWGLNLLGLAKELHLRWEGAVEDKSCPIRGSLEAKAYRGNGNAARPRPP